MMRRYTPAPCEGPASETIKEFTRHLVEIHMALVARLANDPDISDAEADQLMVSMGKVEMFMRCSRYLN